MAIEERIAKKRKKKGRGSSSVGRLDVSEKKNVNNQRKREIKKQKRETYELFTHFKHGRAVSNILWCHATWTPVPTSCTELGTASPPRSMCPIYWGCIFLVHRSFIIDCWFQRTERVPPNTHRLCSVNKSYRPLRIYHAVSYFLTR